MQPFEYLNTTYGLIWTISCIPIGCLLAFFGVWILNHIPAKWLCDYNETPDAELLSGKRFSYVSTGIPTAIAMAVCLVLCRLQFNKGYDIYFLLLSLIIYIALLIAASDLKYQIIPDQFTIAIGVLAAAVSVYDLVRGFNILHGAWWSPLAGAGIGAAVMILIDVIGMIVYHRDGMGFGDVKLFLAIGILTGFPGTIYAFIISILTATVFFVIIIVLSRIMGAKTGTAEEAAENKPEAETMQGADAAAMTKEKDPEKNTDEKEGSPVQEIDGEDDEQTEPEENEVGFGSYLAFGPYIAIAVCAYIALFDLIQYLTGLYLSLFN